jgi:hypothetical protein
MSTNADHSTTIRVPLANRRRFGRREARGGDPRGEALQTALAEVVLLREENARLKTAAHQPASLGRVLAQAGALTSGRDEDDVADDAAQLLVEAMVLRESLLEVCQELGRAIGGVTARLERLGTAAGIPVRAPEGWHDGRDA